MTNDRPLRTGFWLLLIGIPLVFFSLMALLERTTPAAHPRYIGQAFGMIADDPLPPDVDDPRWEMVALNASYEPGPEESRRLEESSGPLRSWWRIPLPADLREPGETWMMLIPYAGTSELELWQAGERVDAHGGLDPPHFLTQVTFVVTNPPASQADAVYLRNSQLYEFLFVPALLIGSPEEMRDLAGTLDIFVRLLPTVVSAMLLLLSGILAAVFLLRRGRDSLYGWYALMLGIWAVHVSLILVERLPVNLTAWQVLTYMTIGWFVIVSAIFVHRITGTVSPLRERLLLGWGVSGLLVFGILLVAGLPMGRFRSYVWDPGMLVIGVYTLTVLVRAARRDRSLEIQGLLIVAFFLLLVGVHDVIQNHTDVLLNGILYFRMAASLALIAFSVLLVHRFVQALDTAEALNSELEERVAEKARELDRQHARARELEQRTLLHNERRRLLSEMHDGLGGHIVHALATAEKEPTLEPMVSPLKLALEDLRLIIDSLDPEDSTFDAVFSSLRARVARTCQSLGIRLHWQIDPLLTELDLNPHEVLTLARIIQEAVTNVVKHANAGELSVLGEYLASEGIVQLTVSDDGCGMPGEASGGRGLTNMRARAAELGAAISFAAQETGTRLQLTWPYWSGANN